MFSYSALTWFMVLISGVAGVMDVIVGCYLLVGLIVWVSYLDSFLGFGLLLLLVLFELACYFGLGLCLVFVLDMPGTAFGLFCL